MKLMVVRDIIKWNRFMCPYEKVWWADVNNSVINRDDRVVQMSRYHWRSPTPTLLLRPKMHRGSCPGLCPVGFWNSMDEDSTTSLGNLLKCFTVLTAKNAFFNKSGTLYTSYLMLPSFLIWDRVQAKRVKLHTLGISLENPEIGHCVTLNSHMHT